MVSLLQSKLLLAHGFRHGFSTRLGGVSSGPWLSLNLARNVGDLEENVRENLERVARKADVEVHRIHQCEQVHGTNVHVVTPSLLPFESEAVQADALVATAAGQCVAVRTADCVPILLADPRSGCVAAVHAGWRGAAAGVLPESIGALLSMTGGEARDLLCAVGPHIRQTAFEVGDEVRAAFRAHHADAIDGRGHIDLALVIRQQALKAGIPGEHFDDIGGCTFADPKQFFSHRREHGKTGRHLALVAAK